MTRRPRLLVTTGAESSGKTTLAHMLSEKLDAPLVEEVSRDYLLSRYREDPGWQYGHEDLLRIAERQIEAEADILQRYRDAPTIVCDTDLLVLLVWQAVRFDEQDPGLQTLFRNSQSHGDRHYLLCHWDIPWEPDPLRENPDDRDVLYQHYRNRLIEQRLDWTEVRGSPDQRLRTALESVSPGRS